VTVLAVVATACGAGGGREQAAPAPAPPKPNGYITVAAADTIAPVLRREAGAFEAVNRLASVAIEAAPSSSLATQLRGGRAADLFVAAGTADMDRIVDAELIYGEPLQFARSAAAGPPPVVFSVALLNTTGDRTTARAFMLFLTTPKGRSILEDAKLRPLS
jgi:molybdate transport system substrate-binding protein